MITGPVIHLLYWAGLGLIALVAFGTVGAAIGIAVKESTFMGALASVPILIIGLLIVVGLTIAWRAACEFFVAIFRIADDLRAMRTAMEAETASVTQPTPTPAPPPPTPPSTAA